MSTITLTLDDMAFGGDAIGHHEGRAVFVPLGISGEKVRVRLQPSSGRLLKGQIVELLEPSPARVEPPCPYFGLCGGCQWQHIAYPQQLQFKTEIVRSQLTRLGRQDDPDVRPMLGMENPWGYRNHVQLKADNQGRIGYFALQSHDVVPVDYCLITHTLLDEMWGALEIELDDLTGIVLRAGVHTGQQLLMLEGSSPEPPAIEVDVPVSCLYRASEEEVTILAGNSFVTEELRGRPFQVSGPSFFQVNTVQAERMIESVAEMLQLERDQTLLDAYCGGGTFGLSLADQAGYVIGIESSPWSLRDAEVNLREDNVTLIEGEVEEVLPDLDEHLDAAILDPPRSGCSRKVLEALVEAGPRRIAYVACDPATQARDIRYLCERGYRLVVSQPVDMFPQTYHIENVALLERQA